ncbi:MAG: acyl-CoA synthetase, partial [Gammaproteobacteria bacterium]
MPHPSVTAETYPHKAAVVMGDSGDIMTYEALDTLSNQVAQLLRSLGIQKGDHIGLMLENRLEFLAICWGAQRAGVIYTPLSTSLKRDEAVYILNNSGARLFLASAAVAEVAQAARAALGDGIEHYLMMDAVYEGFESWEEAVTAQPTSPIDDQANGVAMLYSSGTTGQPKGVFVPPE